MSEGTWFQTRGNLRVVKYGTSAGMRYEVWDLETKEQLQCGFETSAAAWDWANGYATTKASHRCETGT